jgi:glycosyltransferase involved in cell wall biosynthesis
VSTTLIIPTVDPRGKNGFLDKAVRSAEEQIVAFDEIIVEHDVNREGPAVVRNRAAAKVETEFIAFLDDDDWLLPRHHQVLSELDGDVRWPWFEVHGGSDPFPFFRGRQWDGADPHQIPITVMVRTEAFWDVGGFEGVGKDAPADRWGNRAGEDFRLWCALSEAGYTFSHSPETTWVWRHHGNNSSGLPERVLWYG